MTMEIKIDSEMVNKVVAESIIKSALGKGLEDAINKAMKETLEGYNSPVKHLVQQHVDICEQPIDCTCGYWQFYAALEDLERE